ncbi:prephenate dehydrogenase [Nakamurella antarctica]|uniref:Prephenate dehydrogenase n=1 Tax=Nakamurella antarctica TaxID=1902245 RepID=A0A3G8ZPZ3_9ACTN|nr:prephenate dehydrogenase [Nakamurella antarctica]
MLPPVCILGLGLIGGSLMRAASTKTSVFGWSRSDQTRQSALEDGFAVSASLEEALAKAADTDALVVLASPVPTFAPLLRTINDVAPTVRLTDVASVKSMVADLVSQHAPHARFVGSHPMAGTAHSGWRAGSPDLFRGAAWVTCIDEETDIADWLPVAALALAVGSRVVPCESGEHDRAVARISHLPHLLALALAQVGELGGPLAMSLAASSFADGTRVAGTRPELIRAFTETNVPALVDALDDALGIIGVARASLASTGSLVKITEAGHAARLAFDDRGSDLTAVELTGQDLAEQLLAVGSAGGHVTHLTLKAGDPEGALVRALYPSLDGDL